MQSLLVFGLVLAACAGFALPSLIAIVRKHPSWMMITALNVMFGLTVVGWIVALVWVLRPIVPRRARVRRAKRPKSRKATRNKASAKDPAANDNRSVPAVAGQARLEDVDDDAYEAWLDRGGALRGAAGNELVASDAKGGGATAIAGSLPKKAA